MPTERAENSVYGRSLRCKECGCTDPDKLRKTHRAMLTGSRQHWVTTECVECMACGSVSAL